MTLENNISQDRKPGWYNILLVTSLGLNILIIGVVAGAFLRDGKPTGFGPDRNVAALGLRPYYRALDEQDRRELRRSARSKESGFRAGGKVMRTALFALADALETEPFDLEAIKFLLAKQSGTISDNISFGHKLLVGQIARMTPGARAKMAANLRRPAKGPGSNFSAQRKPKPLN